MIKNSILVLWLSCCVSFFFMWHLMPVRFFFIIIRRIISVIKLYFCWIVFYCGFFEMNCLSIVLSIYGLKWVSNKSPFWYAALFYSSHHVVVSMFGLQHGNNFLQVLHICLLWTFRRTEYGDDAFSDVGQIDSVLFFHDLFRSHGCLQRHRKWNARVWEWKSWKILRSEHFYSRTANVCRAFIWVYAVSAGGRKKKKQIILVHATIFEFKCGQPY